MNFTAKNASLGLTLLELMINVTVMGILLTDGIEGVFSRRPDGFHAGKHQDIASPKAKNRVSLPKIEWLEHLT